MANKPTFSLPIEVQLMRDWQPRSRPTRGWVSTSESGEVWNIKLVPGSAAVGHEDMMVRIERLERSSFDWVVMKVTLLIEGIMLGEARAVEMWLGVSDGPSAVAHWPVVASNDNLMFKGRHSLLFRVPE